MQASKSESGGPVHVQFLPCRIGIIDLTSAHSANACVGLAVNVKQLGIVCRRLRLIEYPKVAGNSVLRCPRRAISLAEFEMSWQHSTFENSYSAAENVASAVAPLLELDNACFQNRLITILILEDDDVQRELLVSQLESVGINTVSANSIAQAVSLLAQSRVDMAIIDVDLPDGCGLDFCEATVDDPRTTNLPIIILSSLTDPFLVRRTRAAGGHFFIGKPYDPNVLLAMIERMLDISL